MMTSSHTPSPRSMNTSANALFLYCFMAYAVSYIGRQNLSACLPAIMSDGLMDKAWGGYIATAYMLCYGAGQLINGWSGTRIKPQYMIGTGLLGAGIMNILMGCLTSPWLMMAVWSGNGLCQSMLWAPIIRVFTDRLPAEKRYSAGVNIATSIPVGTVLAYLIPGILLKFTSWRVVFFASGGVLLVAFLIWSVGHMHLADYIRHMDEICLQERSTLVQNPKGDTTASPKPSLIWAILSTGILLVLPCIFCNGALKDAMTAWIPTFFAERFGMDESGASLMTVIVPVVSVSGAYVSTWINKKWLGNELRTSSVMFLLAVVCLLGVAVGGEASSVVSAICLAVCISAMWGANTMFLTMLPYHFAKLNLSSAVTGFLNCFAYFSSAVFTSVYGGLAGSVGWHILVWVWLGIGVCGMAMCLVAGKVWAGKRQILE